MSNDDEYSFVFGPSFFETILLSHTESSLISHHHLHPGKRI
jgi:hypothetical protein